MASNLHQKEGEYSGFVSGCVMAGVNINTVHTVKTM